MRKKQGKIKNKSEANRYRRRLSMRKTIIGTPERPRLCISKTNKHISIQVIDDSASLTIASVQTYGKNAVEGAGKNVAGAKVIGAKLAEILKGKKIEKAVFDRAGYKYTGIVSAIADAIRENGINI